MKKVIPIFLALLILLTSTCFAAYTPDPERWFPLTADEYLDAKTLQYSPDLDNVDFWICYVYPSENKHIIANQKINKTNRTITLISIAEYESSTGKPLDSITVPSYMQKSIKIIPGSQGEFYYELLWEMLPKMALEQYKKGNLK